MSEFVSGLESGKAESREIVIYTTEEIFLSRIKAAPA